MFNVLDTHTLAGLMQHTEAASNHWRSRYVSNVMYFDTEYIDFEKISPKGRKLAPFVTPMDKGVLLTDKGSTLDRFKPAYVKPKHRLDPARTLKRRPGETMVTGSLTPAQRANAILMEYMQDHKDICDRRMEWLTVRAILDGKVTIAGENYPTSVVDFRRDANLTVTKTSGNYWGESGVSIFSDLQTWIKRVGQAEFGGQVTDLTMAPDVWEVFRKDDEIKELLDTNIKGNDGHDINRGAILGAAPARLVGILDGSLNIWVYQDWFENDDGSVEQFMDDGLISLTCGNIEVVECYGAILDDDAGYQSMDIFQKMFKENDPSGVFLLSQSAPLVVPVNPNTTFKAKVLGS